MVSSAGYLESKYNSTATGVTYNAWSHDDNLTGTDANDVVHAWKGQLGSADRIALGEGYDTLCLRNNGLSFDTRDYPLFSGIDVLDVSSAGSNAWITLDTGFLTRTDNNRLIIFYGDNGAAHVNTSLIDTSLYNLEVTDDGYAITVCLHPLDTPQGIDVSAYQRTDDITGTEFADTVSAWLGQLSPDDRIALGAGQDTLLIRNSGVRLDTGDYPLFSGIDILDITASNGHADLTVTDDFVQRSDSATLTIKYTGGIEHLDTSGVNADFSVVLLSGDGDVILSANDDSVTVAEGTTGAIYGMGGDDLLFGSDDADFLFGGAGDDLIVGGQGDDTLGGGTGADTFRYDGLQDGHDTIIDFGSDDVINIGLLLEVNGLAFKSASTAQNDGNIQLAQNGADTVVSFDADGTAGNAHNPIAFLTLQNTQPADVHFAPEF